MMILAGIPGCGKTHFCAALLEWFHGKVADLYAMKESEFLERVRNSFDMKGDYRAEIEYQCEHEFLIYDDLGSTGQGRTEWRQEVIFELINLRYESNDPTIFTTNYTREQVKERLGDRAYSRLYAKENCVIEMFNYPDLRYPDAWEK